VTHGRYEVCGGFDFRGHPTGTVFEARLDPNQERRGIERGAIRLLERLVPTIDSANLTLPAGWPQRQPRKGK
jgi:hypothetical protein